MEYINSVKGKILLGFLFAAIVFVAFNGTGNMNHYSMHVWLHVAAGVLWVGLLYYFNFVQVPGMGEALADTDGPAPETPELWPEKRSTCGRITSPSWRG